MTSNQKLDIVLTCLNNAYNISRKAIVTNHADGSISTVYPNPMDKFLTQQELSWKIAEVTQGSEFLGDLKLILNYLSEYKMIDESEGIKEVTVYFIRYEGRVFIEDGGYVGAHEFKEREKKREILRDRLLVIGSWVAGTGALGLCVIESIKYWKWALSIELWTSFFLLLFCNLLGVIIWQLVLHLRESKEKE